MRRRERIVPCLLSISCAALVACGGTEPRSRADDSPTATRPDADADVDSDASAARPGSTAVDGGRRVDSGSPSTGTQGNAQRDAGTGVSLGDAASSPDRAEAGQPTVADASDTEGGCSVAPGSLIGQFTDPTQATNIAPPDPPGIAFMDTAGAPVNAHGGGIIKVCDTFYLHGEFFSSSTTDNNFNGFSMYSSKDLATWKNEGIILPQQESGELGPKRKGERPHIIRCPSSGEFVLYAHAADTTYQADKEVVYATCPTVNGKYTYKGPLKNASGAIAAHSDMTALTDGDDAYVVTEGGWIYTLTDDCHGWASAKQYGVVNGMSKGIEAPTVFKAAGTYYWIGSDKTGWRANDDFYSTAPALSGPWTYRGYLAPSGKLTWMTQSTWVMPVVGRESTTYVYWGDHWFGNQDTSAPGKHNNLATYVFQPLVFDGAAISLPSYQVRWKLDVGAGTWSK
jgi:hypothetical protein